MPLDASKHVFNRPLSAYVCTDAGAELARQVVEQSDCPKVDVHGGGLSGAARLMSEAFAGGIVLAEMGQIPLDMACECVEELSRFGADVVVLGTASDLAIYRRLRSAGAVDYFAMPVSADDVLAILPSLKAPGAEAAQPVANQAATTLGIAVVGCTGGVGASLLSQNLAAHAASERGAAKRTALLDADLVFGTQAIDLNRDDTRGLFEALSAPERVDPTLLNATMDHLDERLSLYSAQAGAGQSAAQLESGLPDLIPALRHEFPQVLVDLPRQTMMRDLRLTKAFDVVLLPFSAGFAGVHAANRMISHLQSEAPDLRILPVLSDMRRDAGLSRKDIDRAMTLPVAAQLPEAAAALAKAHRAAEPLVLQQPRHPWSKEVARLWSILSTPEASESRGTWRRFFK